MQLHERLASSISKHTVIQNSSSTRFAGSTKSDKMTWCPTTNATINMAEKFKSFYINHVPRQQNTHADALASLAASLDLPARAKEKVLVHSHDLYCLKFALEDNQTPEQNLKVKEVLETSTGPELRDW